MADNMQRQRKDLAAHCFQQSLHILTEHSGHLPPLLYADDEVEAFCIPHSQSHQRASPTESVRLEDAAFEVEQVPDRCAAFRLQLGNLMSDLCSSIPRKVAYL